MIKKKILQGFAWLLTCTLLCGCQQAPQSEVVTSKNDGVLQNKVQETAPHNSSSTDSVSIQWTEEFTSTDESVTFFPSIQTKLDANTRKVVEVSPHTLTETDIQRVAQVLMGDATFYERRTSSNPLYSKTQYQEMINQLSPYANRDTLAELMGESGADTYHEYVETFIELWTKNYETAPEEDPRILCDWTLKKERHYNDHEVEIGGRQISDDRDVLFASVEKDGITYLYSVLTRDGKDYTLNGIHLNLTDGLGLYPVEMAIYRSMLCRTEKPTEAQIQAVVEKAEKMLADMNLGQWKIAHTTVETNTEGNIPEYSIRLHAVPSFEGIPAIWGQFAQNPETAYAAEYGMSFVEFEFSANGDILLFDMNSPLDVTQTINDNVATLDAKVLLEKGLQHLSLSDSGAYGLPIEIQEEIESSSGENLLCQVYLTQAEYGLGRVKIPDSENLYYYVPVIAFRGYTDYVSEKTGGLYYSNRPETEDGIFPLLLCINTIDGSIIQ